MRDVLRHRGPDGEGLWLDGPVGLGHRRLASSTSRPGHQPMANEDEPRVDRLQRRDLQPRSAPSGARGQGHRYRTRSDTETILHLYEEQGERCVERLHGMFAFAIWDRRQSRLLLARDRLGIKPLYYAVTDDELLFASEIKAILAGWQRRPTFNEAVLPEFLGHRLRRRRGDVLPRDSQAAARADVVVVARARASAAPLLAAADDERRRRRDAIASWPPRSAIGSRQRCRAI